MYAVGKILACKFFQRLLGGQGNKDHLKLESKVHSINYRRDGMQQNLKILYPKIRILYSIAISGKGQPMKQRRGL